MTVKERYKKERRRVQQFIKRAEKRGYTFVHDILPAIPKRITEASIRRLEKLTPKKLYEKSRYSGEHGQDISGTRARELERSASAKKASTARRVKQNMQENVSRETIESAYTEKILPENLRDALESEPEYEPVASNEVDFTPPTSSALSVSQVTMTIINQFRERASHFNQIAYQLINEWLTNAILYYGNTHVAKMLEDGAAAGHVLTYEVLYDENKLYRFLSDFLDFLPGLEEGDKELIMESVFDEYNEWVDVNV